MNTIKLVVGDWSGDGHSQHLDYVIESNADKDEINKAYQKGAAELGFDVTDLLDEYEQSSISYEQAHKLADLGVEFDDIEDLEDEMDYLPIGPDEYVECYLAVVRLGNPLIKCKITSNEMPNIYIGGYGLFY